MKKENKMERYTMKRLLILSLMLTSGLMQAAQVVANAGDLRIETLIDGTWKRTGTIRAAGTRLTRKDTNEQVYPQPQAAGIVAPGQPGRFRSFCSNTWQGTKDFGKGLVVGAGVTGAAAVVLAYAKASHSYAADVQRKAELASIKDRVLASGETYGHLAVEAVKKFAEEVPTIVEMTGDNGISYIPESLKPAIKVSGTAVYEMGKNIATDIATMLPGAADDSAQHTTLSMAGDLIRCVRKELSFGALCAGFGVALSNLRELYGSTNKAYVCGLLTAPAAAIAYGVANFNR